MTRNELWDKFVSCAVKCFGAHRDEMPGMAKQYGELAVYWLCRWEEV